MQDTDPDLPWLVEICPASTLKQLGLYRPYRLGTSPAERERRQNARAAIPAAIVEAGR
ncbi:MAG: hypothetical protein K6U88_02850 [Dehalococcoidia bacterium]|nr:hypothetical protein [Dehalococcoidia bacterium]